MGTTARQQVEVRRRLNLLAIGIARGKPVSLDDDLGRLVALHTAGAADPVHEVVLLRRMAPQVIKRLERVMEPGHVDKQAYWRKWSNMVHGHEKALIPVLKDFFHEQGVRVAAAYGHSAIVATRMRAEGDDPPPLDWFDTEGWNAQLGGILADGMKPAMEDAGLAVSASLGGEFDMNAQGVRDYIEGRSTDVAGMVNGTTEDQLRSIVADGAVSGKSIDDIAQSISGYFDSKGQSRAETIARTEVLGASNAASLEAARQSGAITGKQWLTSADDRVCPDCEAMDGEQVALEEPFSSGDDAPPTHVDCRCTLLLLTADEFAGALAEPGDFGEVQAQDIEIPSMTTEMTAYENLILAQPYGGEVGRVYSSAGGTTVRLDFNANAKDPNHLYSSAEQDQKIRATPAGAVVTHLHPPGTLNLSDPDFERAGYWKVKELRSFSDQGIVSLTRNDLGRISQDDIGNLLKERAAQWKAAGGALQTATLQDFNAFAASKVGLHYDVQEAVDKAAQKVAPAVGKLVDLPDRNGYDMAVQHKAIFDHAMGNQQWSLNEYISSAGQFNGPLRDPLYVGPKRPAGPLTELIDKTKVGEQMTTLRVTGLDTFGGELPAVGTSFSDLGFVSTTPERSQLEKYDFSYGKESAVLRISVPAEARGFMVDVDAIGNEGAAYRPTKDGFHELTLRNGSAFRVDGVSEGKIPFGTGGYQIGVGKLPQPELHVVDMTLTGQFNMVNGEKVWIWGNDGAVKDAIPMHDPLAGVKSDLVHDGIPVEVKKTPSELPIRPFQLPEQGESSAVLKAKQADLFAKAAEAAHGGYGGPEYKAATDELLGLNEKILAAKVFEEGGTLRDVLDEAAKPAEKWLLTNPVDGKLYGSGAAASFKDNIAKTLSSRVAKDDRFLAFFEKLGTSEQRLVQGVSRDAMAFAPLTNAAKAAVALSSEEKLTLLANSADKPGGVMYDLLNSFIRQWAGTSADTSEASLVAQEAANREFKLGASSEHLNAGIKADIASGKHDLRLDLDQILLRNMYEQTQQELKDAGIDHVVLARGIRIQPPADWHDAFVEAKPFQADVILQPMSSFASRRQEAENFGDLLLHVDVPAERIIGTARTGYGCLGEREFVVLGGGQQEAVIEAYSSELHGSAAWEAYAKATEGEQTQFQQLATYLKSQEATGAVSKESVNDLVQVLSKDQLDVLIKANAMSDAETSKAQEEGVKYLQMEQGKVLAIQVKMGYGAEIPPEKLLYSMSDSMLKNLLDYKADLLTDEQKAAIQGTLKYDANGHLLVGPAKDADPALASAIDKFAKVHLDIEKLDTSTIAKAIEHAKATFDDAEIKAVSESLLLKPVPAYKWHMEFPKAPAPTAGSDPFASATAKLVQAGLPYTSLDTATAANYLNDGELKALYASGKLTTVQEVQWAKDFPDLHLAGTSVHAEALSKNELPDAPKKTGDKVLDKAVDKLYKYGLPVDEALGEDLKAASLTSNEVEVLYHSGVLTADQKVDLEKEFLWLLK